MLYPLSNQPGLREHFLKVELCLSTSSSLHWPSPLEAGWAFVLWQASECPWDSIFSSPGPIHSSVPLELDGIRNLKGACAFSFLLVVCALLCCLVHFFSNTEDQKYTGLSFFPRLKDKVSLFIFFYSDTRRPILNICFVGQTFIIFLFPTASIYTGYMIPLYDFSASLSIVSRSDSVVYFQSLENNLTLLFLFPTIRLVWSKSELS